MERKPLGQQHDFNRNERHPPPRDLPEHGQHDASEDVRLRRPALGEYPCAGFAHMRGIDVVTGHF